MSTTGVPGHCWGLNGELWHAPGSCKETNCDRECCAVQPAWMPDAIISLRRAVILDQVSKLFDKHSDYKQVIFHRETLANLEILTAVFLSVNGTELAQHILESR